MTLSIRISGVICVALAACMTVHGQAPTQITVIKSQHERLTVPSDIQRIAVGDPDILAAEAINNRELLLLGKNSGRTTLLIWSRDGAVREYICTVHRDLSLLVSALKRIHPSIEAEIAPDRDTIILTGLVPDITFSRAAEGAAHNYLDAAQSPATRVLIQENAAGGPAAPAQPAQPGQPGQPPTATAPQAPPPAETIRVPAMPPPPSGTVINLIRLETLPPLPEQKIADAIATIGGNYVRVRRILKGQVRDDSQDLFVLDGQVPNQVALTRILTIAAQVVTGQVANMEDIRVLADEAGALTQGVGGAGAGAGGAGGGFGAGGGGQCGAGGGGQSGGGGASLNNQIRRNVARAKVIEAGGRVVSFMEVADLPQVRVDIKLYEVNRSKLRNYNPNLISILGTPRLSSLTPSPLAQNLQAGSPGRVGPGPDAQSVLGFLAGTLTSETQLTSGRFAIDAVLSFLEQQGIARSLSSPSLTVLSGELAQFQVGGAVPIQNANSQAGVGVTTFTTYVDFGIFLNVRPLVGDDDTLTLDVAPQICTPDPNLTANLRQTTGTNPTSTAFLTRSLRTSARLQDGQALIIGGLLSRTTNDTQASTPGVRDVPGLGWLFRNFNRTDDSTELIVVLNPAIVRDPLANVALWEFPGASELMEKFGKNTLEAPVKP